MGSESKKASVKFNLSDPLNLECRYPTSSSSLPAHGSIFTLFPPWF
jgi:hypothetical protein